MNPMPASLRSRPRRKQQPRPPRVRLTHLEVRRGAALILRVAIAEDTLADVGAELGALLKKIAPSTRAPIEGSSQEDVAQHDDAHHVSMREHLTEMIGSLCDVSLDDTLKIARAEQARRTVDVN